MLKQLLQGEDVLVAPGVFDGLSARAAKNAGFKALYMSGFAVAGHTYGQPDIGLLTAGEMSDAVSRIKATSELPLIADADNGYGGPNNVAKIVNEYERRGASCIQLEDQVHPKRCGHMEGKAVVSRTEATLKIRAAVDARDSIEFLIMARTDARATDSLKEALIRAELFLNAGADILFIEAPQSLEEMRKIGDEFPSTPLVLNLVEDGKTPIVDHATALKLGFKVILYPVTALLAASLSLQKSYASIPDQDGERASFNEFNDLVGLNLVNQRNDVLRKTVEKLEKS